jgi:hypothetical protein
VIALASLCLLLTPQVTPAQFKTLIDRAEKSDAAVPAALEALSEAALKKGFDLKAYQGAVGQPDFVTSPRRLAVERARKGDIEVVGVTIGSWSRVRGRHARLGDLTFPSSLDFIARYDATPIFVGRSLIVVQTSVQDAGVRYGYRTTFLSQEGTAFRKTETLTGTWTYGDAPEACLSIKGTEITLRTLEEPKSFFTTNADRLCRTTSIWDLSGARPRRKRVMRSDLEIRAIDRWIGEALSVKRPDMGRGAFRKAWGTDRPMLEGWRLKKVTGGSEVTLDLNRRYRFRVTTQGKVSFLGASEL